MISAKELRLANPNLSKGTTLEALDELVREANARGRTVVLVPSRLTKDDEDGNGSVFIVDGINYELERLGYTLLSRASIVPTMGRFFALYLSWGLPENSSRETTNG